jgi:hypothetical protein
VVGRYKERQIASSEIDHQSAEVSGRTRRSLSGLKIGLGLRATRVERTSFEFELSPLR